MYIDIIIKFDAQLLSNSILLEMDVLADICFHIIMAMYIGASRMVYKMGVSFLWSERIK